MTPERLREIEQELDKGLTLDWSTAVVEELLTALCEAQEENERLRVLFSLVTTIPDDPAKAIATFRQQLAERPIWCDECGAYTNHTIWMHAEDSDSSDNSNSNDVEAGPGA